MDNRYQWWIGWVGREHRMCGVIGLRLSGDRAASFASAGTAGGQDAVGLGELVSGMTAQLCERGPDSAGFAVYGDPLLTPPGTSTVSLIAASVVGRVGAATAASGQRDLDPAAMVAPLLPAGSILTTTRRGPATLLHADTDPSTLEAAVRAALPGAVVVGHGATMAVLKGVGDPRALLAAFELSTTTGYQAVGHTRMATESAVTAAHCHPFAVAPDLSFVHNGSFANHATIRRELQADGVVFDSDNDSEVGARFLAWRLAHGDDLEKALRLLTETFDGFFTLVVATRNALAVVRDRVACKPALIAETPDYVAVASEYRALSELPGIVNARISEPEPAKVFLWEH